MPTKTTLTSSNRQLSLDKKNYSKPCVKQPLSKRPHIFQDQLSL